jgi:hypothetical protein
MAPFPTTRVVPAGWSAHHAPVTEGAMNAECAITFGQAGGGWDPTNGSTAGTPLATYTGPCRVQYTGTGTRETDAADQLVAEQAVLVALPRAAGPQSEGARVRVTYVDANGPTRLIGRLLTVRSVNRSSLAWEQDLTCTDDADNQPAA